MKYRKLSPLGDYTFGGGNLDFYKDNPEAVAQSVQTRLLLWLGEWFLNTDSGTPYMQGIFGKKTKQSMDATIQDRVLSTQGVTGIENYSSEIDGQTRKALVSFDLNTVFGPTKVEIDNYSNF